MKIKIIVCLVFCASLVQAQKSFKIKESIERIANGSNNALTISIYEAKVDDVEKAWKRLMKDYKAKVSSNDELFADNATISSISANTIDVYAKFESVSETEIKLIVAFDLGGGFVSTTQYPAQDKAAQEILKEFAIKTSKEAVAEKLAAAEKDMRKLYNEKENLIKNNESLHKKIEGWEKDIVTAKEDIKTNEADQVKKEKEIDTQKVLLELIKAKDAELR